MELSNEVIQENFNKFLEILEPAVKSRVGNRWDALKEKLTTSDFSIAPASTKFHASYRGGLVDHSLNVYYNLCSCIKNKHLEDQFTPETIAIVALLHDISKMDYYEPSLRNKKVYFEQGTKHDEFGNFDWVSEKSYTTKDDENRFVYGNHEETSEFIARQYVPLTYIESIAILYHHGGLGYDSTQNTASKVMNKYPLTVLLHLADCLATYIDEGSINE